MRARLFSVIVCLLAIFCLFILRKNFANIKQIKLILIYIFGCQKCNKPPASKLLRKILDNSN